VVDQVDSAGSLPKRLARYRQAIADSPPPTEKLNVHGVDRALKRIIERCLALDPSERFANAQEILQSLARRQQIRARRPLMLLGIVGPLLLLTATCVFAVRSIQSASEGTKSALRQEAFGSNQLAARFAARTLESELERYFSVAAREASSSEFLNALAAVLTDTETRGLLQEIATAKTPAESHRMAAPRERLLDHPARIELDQFLEQRLAKYADTSEDSRQPLLATMFVTDGSGTMVAIAYETEVERSQNSTGRNFAFRTYFHGGEEDLSQATPIDSIAPLRSTHLSAAFQSTATGTWKVAISTPVYLGDQRERPDAVFVATIDLGDFHLLQSEKGANQVAVLIEARDGPGRGTVLQHPLLDLFRESGKSSVGKRFQVRPELMDRLLAGGDVDYQDPVAVDPDGKDYAGNWIAAIQPVALPMDIEVDQVTDLVPRDTDLLVLVQYRLDTVFAPVGQMRTALLWEGAAAVGSIVLVTFTLWMMVIRTGASKLPPVARDTPASGDTETIAV